MSLLKTGAVQVGQSGTASNNFHWRNLLDGLLRLSRGNAGDASPTDVMRVKADNSVEFPGGIAGMNFSSLLSANGYQKLPSGLIIQWGITGSLGSAGTLAVTLPIAFPTACLNVQVQRASAVAGTTQGAVNATITSNSQITIRNGSADTLTPHWMAIGY